MDTLNEKDQKAIKMRYAGNAYTEIAAELGVALSTVKHWFEKKGRLLPYYQAYNSRLGEIMMEEAIECQRKQVQEIFNPNRLRNNRGIPISTFNL